MIALDTHVVVWLHAGETDRLPPQARQELESGHAVVCPMVKLELEYLFDSGRIRFGGERILSDLAADIGLVMCGHPFPAIVQEALRMTWTRDPFDRLIAGHAVAAGHQLATKDETILSHCPVAMWR